MFRPRVLSNFRHCLKNQQSARQFSTNSLLQSTSNSKRYYVALASGVAAGVFIYSSIDNFFAESQKEIAEKLFKKYATGKTADGQVIMSEDDLRKLIGPSTNEYIAILRSLVQQQGGIISLQTFEELFELLSAPDAEFRIAFRLADKNKNGIITKEEFQHVLSSISDQNRQFNWSSDWVNLFFGKEGTGQLTFSEFSQLLEGLPGEQMRQEFANYYDAQTGLVSADHFIRILQDARIQIPPGISIEKIKELAIQTNPADIRGDGISYAQCKALSNFFVHLPSYAKILSDATKVTGKQYISPDEFFAFAKKSLDITPLERDIVFHFIDTKKDGKLDMEEFGKFVAGQSKPISKPEIIQHNYEKPKSFIYEVVDTIFRFGLGAIAGGIGATAVYPIDLVKTRMQNQKTLKGSSERLYKNSFDCFLKVIKNEGAVGLYRGLGPQLVGVAPEKAIKLTTNDVLRKLFTDKNGEIYFPLELVAGGGAGASQVVFTNPLEIVKIRLQVQGEALRTGSISAAEKQGAITICKELGISGLYKGSAACLLRDIPFSAIYFPTYSKMKASFTSDQGVIEPYQLLLAGAIAGVPAAGLVTPADVIKTRLQVKHRAGDVVYSGIRDCTQKIWQLEGFGAFWKGSLARVCRSSPQFGVTLLAYELLQRLVGSVVPPSQPPLANVPVTREEMEIFRSNVSKMDIIEKKWFDVYSKEK